MGELAAQSSTVWPDRGELSLDHGLVDEFSREITVVYPLVVRRLQHQDGNKLFLPIDPEVGAASSAPVKIAHRAGQRAAPLICSHREAETEAGAEATEVNGLVIDAMQKMESLCIRACVSRYRGSPTPRNRRSCRGVRRHERERQK
jgi:hypothetical protein